jgi:WD40 repeat protein
MTRQLQLFDDVYETSPPHAKGLKQRLHRFFYGDDIFISYSRSDSGKYAMALAVAMSEQGYLCFLDQLGTDVNRNMPESLKGKVRNSTALVLIGTEGAAASRYVREEVEIFKESKRPIHPISIDEALTKEEWPELAGLTWISESRKRVEKGEPAPETITQLKNASRYRRRNQILRLSLIAGFAFIALTVLASLGISSAWVAKAEANRVVAVAEAKTARGIADTAKGETAQAIIDKGIAEGEATTAKGNAKTAQDEAKEAITQKGLAEEGTRRAQGLEREAKERAAATARSEAGQRATVYSREPGLEFEALSLAVGAAAPDLSKGRRLPEPILGGLTAAVTSLEQAVHLQGVQDRIKLSRISADGSRVFVATYKKPTDSTELGTERWGIWDARTGKLLKLYLNRKQHWVINGVTSASFSRDGARLAVIDQDGEKVKRDGVEFYQQKFWLVLCDEVRGCKPRQELPSAVYFAALDRDGRRLAFFMRQRTQLYLLDLDWSSDNPLPAQDNWRPIEPKPGVSWGPYLAFAGDGRLITSSDNSNTRSWLYDVGKCETDPSNTEDCQTFKADPDTFLVGVTDTGTPILSDKPEPNAGSVEPENVAFFLPQWTADGEVLSKRTFRGFKGGVRNLAIVGGHPYAVTQHDEEIYVSGANSAETFATFRAHNNPLSAVRYSHNGLMSASLDQQSVLNVWKVETGELLFSTQLPESEEKVQNPTGQGVVAFSEDDSRVVAVNEYGGFGIWDTGKREESKRGNQVARCLAPKEAWQSTRAIGIALFADADASDRIVTKHYLNKFQVWKLDCSLDRRVETHLHYIHMGPGGDNLFSSDGRQTVTFIPGSPVERWNLVEAGTPTDTGARQLTPEHIGSVPKGPFAARAVAFEGGVTLLLVNENDGSFYVWREGWEDKLQPLRDFVKAKNVWEVRATISADGKRAAAFGPSGEVIVWDLIAAEPLLKFNLGTGKTSGLIPFSFSADDQSLMMGSSDGTARIYPVTIDGFVTAARQMLASGRP